MSKIRVMHCLGQLNTGGAETLVMNILRKIDKDKFQFDFLLFNNSQGFYDNEAKSLGANLYYTSSMGKAGLVKYVKEMIDFFKREKIDIVHSHMDWQGGFIAYAAHKAGIKKIVVHSHANQKMFDHNFIYHNLIKISKQLVSKYATDCLACSKEAGESLFNNDFDVLINGIDMDKYLNPNQEKILALKKEFNIKENEIILGNVGSFSENKNQSFLIKSLYELHKNNKNYRLILVGDGEMRKKLKKEVVILGLQEYVLFTGVRSDIPEIMHLFDIFLFPSIHEGLGIVAIEAQASGVPCIISDSVPHEVELGVGLVKFLSLDVNKWIEMIKFYNFDNCFKYTANTNFIFDINTACQKLIGIYKKN